MIRLTLFTMMVLALILPASAQTMITSDITYTPTSTPAPTSAQPHAPTAAESRPIFELDVVFPRENQTYNNTDYLPIIFAFQNTSAAASIGPFMFTWGIMPYGVVSKHRPGGIFEDMEEIKIGSDNASQFENPDGSPYILVNATNMTLWDHGPSHGEPSVYALQWYIQWDQFWDNDTCRDSKVSGDDHGQILFNIQPETFYGDVGNPNPGDLGNVTGECARFAAIRAMDNEKPDLCEKAIDSRDRSMTKRFTLMGYGTA